jgi:hypothetical protein
VQRRAKGARRQRVLDEAERAAGLLAVDHEADAEGEQVHELAFVGADQTGGRRLHLVHPFD